MTDHERMLCEAAACAWEHALQTDRFKHYAEDVGYSQLRMEIIELAPLIDQDFKQVQDNYTYCFDWDFVPAWITANVEITDDDLRVRPDREIPC